MPKHKWKRFEHLVFDIQKEFTPNANLTLDDRILGKTSGVPRQIDISIRKHVGQFELLVAIECKDHARPVDIEIVEAFASKLKDVGANKGAIISANGFTSAALEFGRASEIDLFRLVDTESKDWGSYLTIPALLTSLHLRSYQVVFSKFKALPGYVAEQSVGNLMIWDSNGKELGTIFSCLAKIWNEQEVEFEPGRHNVMIAEDQFLKDSNRLWQVSISAAIIVQRLHYFAQLPVHLRGLRDEHTGATLTKEMLFEEITPSRIRAGQDRNWRLVDDPGQLAVRPALTMSIRDYLESDDPASNDEELPPQ